MILERVRTNRGELVLREREGCLEIISNGVFLMDTAGGTSERLLVDAALSRCSEPAPRLLIGGLGVGRSLAAAVADTEVAAIDVVEIEPAVIAWHARYFEHITGQALGDPRVRVIEADVVGWLARNPDTYDAICLDTDNGPNWLVYEDNAAVYDEAGVRLAERGLRPDGVLGVWSASRDPLYEQRLRNRFGALEVLETPHERGRPDVVYVVRAARPPLPSRLTA